MSVDVRPIDRQRALRLLLASITKDPDALDFTADECTADSFGTGGLIRTLSTLAGVLARMANPDDAEERALRGLTTMSAE